MRAVSYQTDAPICVATLLCNEVIEDVRSHNKSAIGIFNAIQTPSLPATHPRMFLMVSLTNVKGNAAVRMVLRSPSGKSVANIEGKIDNGDPLATYDLVIELLSIPLEEEGVHVMDVFSGDHHVGGRRFSVMLAK
jgi:hypothetical protein